MAATEGQGDAEQLQRGVDEQQPQRSHPRDRLCQQKQHIPGRGCADGADAYGLENAHPGQYRQPNQHRPDQNQQSAENLIGHTSLLHFPS
mgnify:CR=1 FL=1